VLSSLQVVSLGTNSPATSNRLAPTHKPLQLEATHKPLRQAVTHKPLQAAAAISNQPRRLTSTLAVAVTSPHPRPSQLRPNLR